MSNISAPQGFKPVRRLDGAAYAGAITPYRIASGYSANIGCGDVVKLLNTGYINVAGAGDRMRGVFIGCEYTAANGQRVKSPYWPASTATLGAQDATAFVIDDRNVVFETQMSAAMTVPTDLGLVGNLATGSVNTAIGLSTQQLDYTTLSATGLTSQFRVLEVVPRVDNDTASAYCKVLVVPSYHDFNVLAGI